jgi:hypothetical protein
MNVFTFFKESVAFGKKIGLIKKNQSKKKSPKPIIKFKIYPREPLSIIFENKFLDYLFKISSHL